MKVRKKTMCGPAGISHPRLAHFRTQEDDEDDDDDEEAMTEEQRMEEGRRMFQIFAARMFEQRVLESYREQVRRPTLHDMLRPRRLIRSHRSPPNCKSSFFENWKTRIEPPRTERQRRQRTRRRRRTRRSPSALPCA